MIPILTKISVLIGLLSVALAQTNNIAITAPIIASSTPPSIIDLIEQNFAPMGEKVAKTALRIATCESRLNPKAVNKESGATGLFQILKSTGRLYKCDSLTDPESNIKCATKIREVQGDWRDWKASEQCWK